MRLNIEKLIYGGDGLARLPADERGRGKAVFVPFVLPGEEIEAAVIEQRPGFARAKASEILRPASIRIGPHCPYFQCCGGCQYQHTTYEEQLNIKAEILKENLRRIAKIELATELTIHPSPPWSYRNRVRLKIETLPEFALGYYKVGSHDLLAVEQCPISSPLINKAIAMLWTLGREGKLADEFQEVELFAGADDSHLLVEAYARVPIKRAAAIEAMEVLQRMLTGTVGVVVFPATGLIPGQEFREKKKICNTGQEFTTVKVGDCSYRVSAGAFFQTNRYLASELVKLVTTEQGGETALDLYAGVGLFAVVLAASFAQVIAVEGSQTSHADLAYNSPRNVEAVQATTEIYLKQAKGKMRPDLVILDPPRSGLGEAAARDLAAMQVPQITYVSCDPATVARDLGILLKSGYRIDHAQLIDLFPQTYHIESIFHLGR